MSLDKLLERAEKIANEFAHLKIITAVGDFKYTAKSDGTGYEVAPGANNSAMQTRINLVDGDITNLVAREFTTEAMADMRAFHETQVLEAQEIVKGNIEALVSLVKLVSSIPTGGGGGGGDAGGNDGSAGQ